MLLERKSGRCFRGFEYKLIHELTQKPNGKEIGSRPINDIFKPNIAACSGPDEHKQYCQSDGITYDKRLIGKDSEVQVARGLSQWQISESTAILVKPGSFNGRNDEISHHFVRLNHIVGPLQIQSLSEDDHHILIRKDVDIVAAISIC